MTSLKLPFVVLLSSFVWIGQKADAIHLSYQAEE